MANFDFDTISETCPFRHKVCPYQAVEADRRICLKGACPFFYWALNIIIFLRGNK